VSESNRMTCAQAVTTLRKKWEAHHAAWLVQPQQGNWPLSLKLHDLTEKDVLKDLSGTREWVGSWRHWERGDTVEWGTRRWNSGEQEVPQRLVLDDASQVAAVFGEASAWARAQRRHASLSTSFPALAGQRTLVRHCDAIFFEYSERDFERLCALLQWLVQHPRSGLYLRQLPIAGFDTKWAEVRMGLVRDLMQLLHGKPEERNFEALCGLRAGPARVRMRILCEQMRQQLGGAGDIEAPVEDLAGLGLQPRTVLIVENLETGLALPPLPGVVAFMKLGHSIGLLENIRWAHDAPRHVYWGDIDTHGLAILARARLLFPRVQSLLMDEATLLAHRELWVREPVQSSAGQLAGLTPQELDLFKALKDHRWSPGVRLEQERLDWPTVLSALGKVLGQTVAGSESAQEISVATAG
jgi:hypothetical protein